MEEMNKKNNTPDTENGQEKMNLDDARRVKVLSPTQLVMKRFFRNRLAVIGLAILVFMFVFSFFGSLISPYSESEVFKGYETVVKDYAGAAENKENSYIVKEGASFPGAAKSAFQKAISSGKTEFTSDGIAYQYEKLGENIYQIFGADTVASAMKKGRAVMITAADGFDMKDDFKKEATKAVTAGDTSFEFDDVTYVLGQSGNKYTIGVSTDIAVSSYEILEAYNVEDASKITYEFAVSCLTAIADGKTSFDAEDVDYKVEENNGDYLVTDASGNEFAIASTLKVSAKASDIKLSGAFKTQIREAIRNNENTVAIPETAEDGTTTDINYTLTLSNGNYLIKGEAQSETRRSYEAPSAEHWLGLDGNGMDVMIRLMYGGRISLMVGFIVVFIELFIGIIIGGISGFFGGAVDTVLMRFVDLFNSIPFWPMVIIAGSVMDNLELPSGIRLFALMAILGVLGWTGIARVVRGQILTLREQDFMVATEATGIRVSRRIFRHLVPNVMPLLIVQATMGLGGIIITEATLSFLGLGVKYPMASWGSIINAANDIHIMTNYWFIWLPAGLLIFLTVLGFNFVGDGLRDAFDPKMKR